MRIYVAFTQVFGFVDFPVTERSLQAFAEFMLRSSTAPKSVLNALGSIRHFSLDHRLPVEAFDSRAVQLWCRALPHTCRHVPQQAPPVSTRLLTQLCELSLRLGESGVVLATLMAFLFATMARLSSLVSHTAASFDYTRLPSLADVLLQGGVWHLRLKWAKAHQDAAQGYWVPLLPRPGSAACPVACWSRLRGLRESASAGEPLFWCPGQQKGAQVSRRPLSMSVARAWLNVLLRRLGRQDQGFTFHSFRRGACTLAFESGAAEGDIKALGGWKSDAVRAYLPVGARRRRAAQALVTNPFPLL